MNFNAATFARGWLSVACASSTDKDDATFRRTVHVEMFDSGVQLTASDRYILLTSWVPNLDAESDLALCIGPDVDSAPIETAVARDYYGRGISLLYHLLSIAPKEDSNDPQEVSVKIGDKPQAPGTLHLDTTPERAVTLEHPRQELVHLDIAEIAFPDWRFMVAGHVPRQTKQVAIPAERLEQLAKVGKLHSGKPILWRFGGLDKTAAVEVGEGFPRVQGVVMPARWAWGEEAIQEAG